MCATLVRVQGTENSKNRRNCRSLPLYYRRSVLQYYYMGQLLAPKGIKRRATAYTISATLSLETPTQWIWSPLTGTYSELLFWKFRFRERRPYKAFENAETTIKFFEKLLVWNTFYKRSVSRGSWRQKIQDFKKKKNYNCYRIIDVAAPFFFM